MLMFPTTVALTVITIIINASTQCNRLAIAQTKTIDAASIIEPATRTLKTENGTNSDFRLRHLNRGDIEYVNSTWPYSTSKSIYKIQKQIEDDNSRGPRCCLGIEILQSEEKKEKEEPELVACILQYHNGALGMLHVDDKYRRLGLGAWLLSEATRILLEQGLPCFAFIMDNNKASESLFLKQGWVKEEPHGKKGTGRRRAKRKWIKAI